MLGQFSLNTLVVGVMVLCFPVVVTILMNHEMESRSYGYDIPKSSIEK